MLRTYQMYAGLTFLGYEYAEDREQALINTRKKYGAPKLWNIEEYDANIIHWREENETETA